MHLPGLRFNGRYPRREGGRLTPPDDLQERGDDGRVELAAAGAPDAIDGLLSGQRGAIGAR